MTEQQRRGAKLAASAVVLAGSGFFIWNSLGQTGMASRANTRVFICTDCEGTFRYKIKMGDIEPLPCRHCDKEAAYGAEACYWAKDGASNWTAKKDPTWVIVRERMGLEGKTYCPDCEHEVVGHNPRPPQELMDAAG
ncbi:MAG: hypothetical protein V3T70_05470 [Phycisphaerae bacterium]